METKTPKVPAVNGNKSEVKKLPTIAELYKNDTLPTMHKESLFQVLVNQEPKKEWLKDHPTAKREVKDDKGNKRYVPVQYLPIERVEWLLTNIFLKTRVEIKESKQIANSVVVTVRLHYYNHIDKEWDWQDGIGASPLQTEKGAGAIEWDKIKSSAVQMGAPAAETYAVKDAAEKIGKLFGRDLNRADQTNYDNLSDKYAKALD
jgi:hypothetical protein